MLKGLIRRVTDFLKSEKSKTVITYCVTVAAGVAAVAAAVTGTSSSEMFDLAGVISSLRISIDVVSKIAHTISVTSGTLDSIFNAV